MVKAKLFLCLKFFILIVQKRLDFWERFVYLIIRKFDRGIAQLVERRSPKPNVVSSNLTAPANKKRPPFRWLFLLAFRDS